MSEIVDGTDCFGEWHRGLACFANLGNQSQTGHACADSYIARLVRMQINIPKCEVMKISSKRSRSTKQVPLTVNGHAPTSVCCLLQTSWHSFLIQTFL